MLVQFLSLAEAALQKIHRGQVGLELGHPGIGRRNISLQRAEYLLEHPCRVIVPAQRLVGATKVVERENISKIVGAAAFGCSFVSLRFGKGGGVIASRIQSLKTLLRSPDVELLSCGLLSAPTAMRAAARQ